MLRKTLGRDRTLMEQAGGVEVYGRRKELYSLWHKMKTKGEDNLDQITDVVALRVIIKPKQIEQQQELEDCGESDRDVWLCYHVLGLVQHLPGFQPVPTKVKDYISLPKPNGYQSLHTALMLNGQSIEVQIRTSAMHRVAEYGMASHWAFYDEKKRATLRKDDKSSSTVSNQDLSPGAHDTQEDHEQIYNTPWLSSIKEWQDEVLCSRDFVDCVRRELLGKRVFVFLRNGKILNLAKGSTVIDAAFQIRTDVGLKMHGVEINGKPVPFSYELKNGDVISVLTGNGKPSTEWMRYATIRSTRSKLRSYFRQKQRESHRDAGEILLLDFISMHACVILESSQRQTENLSIPTSMEEMKLLFHSGRREASACGDIEDLLVEVGKRSSKESVGSGADNDREFLREIVADIFQVPLSILDKVDGNKQWERQKKGLVAVEGSLENRQTNDEKKTDIKSSSSKGSDSEHIEIADPEYLCSKCLPVLGDEIIGTRLRVANNDDSFTTTTVHRRGCSAIPHATRMTQTSLKRQQLPLAGRKISASVNCAKREPSMMRSRLKMRFAGRNGGVLQVPGRKNAGGTGGRVQHEVVKVEWDDSYISSGEEILYLAEVSVIAEDRKLLLADCSEVVSSMSKIIKTGSLSTEEHAVLEFLIKVESLDHLQRVMDNLMDIQDVMSVERKFGTSL